MSYIYDDSMVYWCIEKKKNYRTTVILSRINTLHKRYNDNLIDALKLLTGLSFIVAKKSNERVQMLFKFIKSINYLFYFNLNLSFLVQNKYNKFILRFIIIIFTFSTFFIGQLFNLSIFL